MLRNKLLKSLRWYAEKLKDYHIWVADFSHRIDDSTEVYLILVDDLRGYTSVKLLLNEVICPFEEEIYPKFRRLHWKDNNTNLYFYMSVYPAEEYENIRKTFTNWKPITTIVGPIE